MKTDGLEFVELKPGATGKPPCIKAAVLKDDSIRLTLNAEAMEKLGTSPRVEIGCASRDDEHFVKLTPAHNGKGVEVISRRPHNRGRPCGLIRVRGHSFEPGVTHGATPVVVQWLDVGAIVQMPDWNEILGSLKGDDEPEE